MNALDRYADAVEQVLASVQTTQRDAVEQAAQWLSATLQQDGLLYITGTGHSHMIAEEVFYRAGGLAAVYPLLEPSLMLHEGAIKSSAVERLEGLAEILLEDTSMGVNDLLIVASNSGRNAFPIEMVLEAKKRGCRTVAVTSLKHSQRIASRHSSGKRLFEVADLVVDTDVPYGDASVEITGLASKVGAVSTIVGTFIINSIVVRAVELCVQAGYIPEIFVSANVQESDQTVDIERWRQRIKRL